MSVREEARRIHEQFHNSAGSQHIGSEHAVQGLIRWVERRRPRTVLEVGAGIGTLTYTLVRTLDRLAAESRTEGRAPYTMVAVEAHPYCVGELKRNLAEHLARFRLVADMDELPEDFPPRDFVVVDGGVLDDRYFSALEPRAVVFVEGSRAEQRKVAERVMGGRPWVRANFRPAGGGGYWLYQLEPTPAERAWFASWNAFARTRGAVLRLVGRGAGPDAAARPPATV
ncbi:MAG TPA: hypothetical protein VEX86_17360 [Longimicrobium sp.]|nr:hypothetical protein [Longimicrobium sp.]